MQDSLQSKRRTVLILFAATAFLAVFSMGKYVYEGLNQESFLRGDFVVFWQTARRVATKDHSSIYSFDDLESIADGKEKRLNKAFVYPPVFASFLGGMGMLPPEIAYYLWIVVIAGFYIAVIHLCWRRSLSGLLSASGGRLLYALILLATPLLYTSIFTAQVAGLLAGLLLLGLYFLPRNHLLAGVCFGLMCIKPPYALLVGFIMLIRGKWRVITAACVTALIAMGLSVLHLGYERWGEWLALLPQFMDSVTIVHPSQFDRLALSPFYVMNTLLGLSSGAALAVQSVVSIVLLAGAVWMFRQSDSAREKLRIAWLLIATLMVSPHMLGYDLLLVTLSILILLNHVWEDERNVLWAGVISVCVAISPFIQVMGIGAPVPYSLLAIIVLLAYTTLLYIRCVPDRPNP